MSSLLPSSHTQFQLKDYWEQFFQKRAAPFEWYGEYLDLCHILHKYIKQQNNVLVVGCGNSKLSEGLYDSGCRKIENIDISEVVIKQMSAKNKDKRPLMKYHTMDMLNMSYEDSTFDCVIDKGTLDAICVNEQNETLTKVTTMFSEIKRVLKTGGRYVCITLSQEHILKQLLVEHSQGWVVRVHVIQQRDKTIASTLPVFVFVMTKMATIPEHPPVQVFEYVAENDKCIRCQDTSDVAEFVKNCQQYALVQYHLNSLHLDEQITVDLWSTDNSVEPRYTLRIVDLPRRKATNGLFAIFLVPQGRETNWLFSSESGCSKLAESAGYERLVIVTFHRGHTYPGLDRVKEEVSAKAMELCQEGLPEGKKWPVLTLGDGLGSRSILMEDMSSHSGRFVVEESKSEEDTGGWIRRLVFLDLPHLAQTEVLMIPQVRSSGKRAKSKKHKPAAPHIETPPKLQFDHSHLVFPFHKVMIGSLALIDCDSVISEGEGEMVRILIVGLGGGALPMLIKKYHPNIIQDVVELDPKMVEVAVKWFGFEYVDDKDTKLNVIVDDGVHFITSSAKKYQSYYHAIMLDVDNKDPSIGLSSPPLAFTTSQFLNSVISLLHPNGIFVCNLSARNKDVEKSVFDNICSYFPLVIRTTVPEYVHDVIVGFPKWRGDIVTGNMSSDNHMTVDTSTGDTATVSSKVYRFLLSKNLQSRLEMLSQLIYRRENSEFFEYFNNSSLWIMSNTRSN